MFRRFGPAGGNYRDGYGSGDCRSQRNVETTLRAIAIHRGEQNFTCTRCDSHLRPFDGVKNGGLPPAAYHDIPMIAGALRINRKDDGLRAELPRQFGDELEPFHRGGVHGDLVGAGAYYGASVFERSNAAARGERDGQLRGDAADGFEESRTAVARRGNVQHHQFVGAFGVITRRQRVGLTGITQPDEVDALDDAFTVGIEARNNAVREAHAARLRKFRRTRAPESLLFSGWNCTA